MWRRAGVRRVNLAEKLRRIPLSFFGKKDLADLTSSIMNDCAVLESSQSHYVEPLFGAILSTTLISVSLLFFNWRMALAAIWPLPVAFAIVALASDVQKGLSRRSMAAKIACEDGIQECMEAMPDLRANNAEERYLSGLAAKIRALESRLIQTELGTALFVVSASLVLRLGVATTALAGAALLVAGKLDVLTFFMFLLVVSRLYDPLEGALQNLAAVISTNTNIERMNSILDCPVQTGSEKLTNRGCDVTFDHVGFSYDGGETVLRDVSFTAKQGQVTALVGPSGGGKTTVSRLAARFWDIPRGKITVGGMDVSKIDPEALMSLYSIVFQDVTLFDNTILENIRIGRKDATDEEVIAAAKLANVDEFAEKLPEKWNSNIGENGCELSGGERQRISIARAFLKDAPIILLDEATASLDVENETAIQQPLEQRAVAVHEFQLSKRRKEQLALHPLDFGKAGHFPAHDVIGHQRHAVVVAAGAVVEVLLSAQIRAPVREEVGVLPLHLLPDGILLLGWVMQRDFAQNLLFAGLGIEHVHPAVELQLAVLHCGTSFSNGQLSSDALQESALCVFRRVVRFVIGVVGRGRVRRAPAEG